MSEGTVIGSQHAFTEFVSSKSCADMQLEGWGDEPRPNLEGPKTSSDIEFDQLQYSEMHDVKSLTVAYQSHGANQLTFVNRPGLQFHLRRKGTGIYSFDRSEIVEGAVNEMQIYCSPHAWCKNIFERPDANARSMVFGLPYAVAKRFMGNCVEDVYRFAETSFFHTRIPIRAELLNPLDELFIYNDSGISKIRRDARLLDVLAGSIEGFRATLKERAVLPSIHPQDVIRIRAAETRILNDLAGYSGIASLAAETGMSPSKFKILFQQVTGSSVGQYVRNARMQLAASLLGDNRQIAEVAYAIGYRHVGHFAHTFRDTFNITPSHFRDQKRRLKLNS